MLSALLSEGEQLTRVFEDLRPSKQSFLKVLESWAARLPFTRKGLPTLLLLHGEAPGGCCYPLVHFLLPDVAGFLKWKEA